MKPVISLQLKNISKCFYGSYAIKNITLDLYEGEVHIICGENGAGKSTLMKILSGMYQRDNGEIFYYGGKFNPHNPKEAEKLGIITIYQEFNLSPTISVAENIFLNREPGHFFVNRKKLRREAQKYLDLIGCKVSPDTNVALLSTANQQLVQIAKALSQEVKVLIMDEPCASISEEDTDKLFALTRELKKQGVTIIYIDHRIENFKKVGDRVSVLRDGEIMGTLDVATLSRDEIIKLMVGRELNSIYPKTSQPGDSIQFEIRNFNNKKLKNVNLSVRKGEVLGIAGLVGAGRSEILKAIFGVDYIHRDGKTLISEKEVVIKCPTDAIKYGIAFVPEDRKIMGFIPDKTIDFNLILPSIREMGWGLFIDRAKVRSQSAWQRENLRIKSLQYNTAVRELSGGNQQKVVIGKWLMRDDIELLLLDEPTRGVDVGVKIEIYKIIDTLACTGKAIIMVSSEMPELIGMCDRILTMVDGKITGSFNREQVSQEEILEKII